MHLHPHGLFCCIQILHILLNPKSQFSPSFIHRPLVISHFAASIFPPLLSKYKPSITTSSNHKPPFLVLATSRFFSYPIQNSVAPNSCSTGILREGLSWSPHNNDESLSRQRLASSALPGHTTHQAPSPASRLRMVNGMAFTTSPPLDVNDVTDVTYVRLSCLVYILPNITCQLVARHQCDAYQNNFWAIHTSVLAR